MKWSVIISGIAATFVATGLALAATPEHDGYPYGGKGMDLYGKAAEAKATEEVNKEFLGGYPKKIKAAEDNSRSGIKPNKDDPRHPAHPGYPYR
jgi:hypothetical protein